MLLTQLMLKNFLKFQVPKFIMINRYHYNMLEQPKFYTNKHKANYLFAEYQKNKNIDFNDSLTYLKRLYLIWKDQKFDLQDHRLMEISKKIFQNFDNDKISLYDKIIICDFYRITGDQEKYEKTTQILKAQIHKMDLNELSHFILTQQGNKEFKFHQIKHFQSVFVGKCKSTNDQQPTKIKIISIQNQEYLTYEQIQIKINQEKSKNNNEIYNYITKKNMQRLIVGFAKLKVFRNIHPNQSFRRLVIQTLFVTNKFQQVFYQIERSSHIIMRICDLRPRIEEWILIFPHVQLLIKADPKYDLLIKDSYQRKNKISNWKKLVLWIRIIIENQTTFHQSDKQNFLQIEKNIKNYAIQIVKNYIRSKKHTKDDSRIKYLNSKLLELCILMNVYEEQIFSPILSDVMTKIDKYNVLNLIVTFKTIDKVIQKYNINLQNQKEIIKEKLWEKYPAIQSDGYVVRFHEFVQQFSLINEMPQNIKTVYNENIKKVNILNNIKISNKIQNSKKTINTNTNHDQLEIQEKDNDQSKFKILFGHKYFQNYNNKLDQNLFLKANNLLDQQQTEEIQEYQQQNISKTDKKKQNNPLFNKTSNNKSKQKNNAMQIQKKEVKQKKTQEKDEANQNASHRRVLFRKKQNKSKKDIEIQIESSNKVQKQPQKKKQFLKMEQQKPSKKEKNRKKTEVDRNNKKMDQKVIIQKDRLKGQSKIINSKQKKTILRKQIIQIKIQKNLEKIMEKKNLNI